MFLIDGVETQGKLAIVLGYFSVSVKKSVLAGRMAEWLDEVEFSPVVRRNRYFDFPADTILLVY
jgi:hypothetical protein